MKQSHSSIHPVFVDWPAL